MKVRILKWFLSVGMLLAVPLCANAALVTYSFNLSGAQETPANGSPAAGSAQFTIDDVADTVSFTLVALNLQGTTSGIHIHAAPAGVAGSIVFDLFPALDFAGPVTIGPVLIPNSLAATGANKGLPVGLGALITAAPWDFYVNLHTSAFPGGEIRGQLAVAPVPVPAAVWLFSTALGGLGLLRRRNA